MSSRKVDWNKLLEADAEEDERIERVKAGERPRPAHKPKGEDNE